ncbi:MAG: hypothetical protein JRF35_10065 [Deltaproteobacteria bacterium]|nr:hypothetical protein [Deltaproteobacteria bacterium]
MKGNRALLFLVIALIAGGLLILYFNYFGKDYEEKPAFQQEKKAGPKGLGEAPSVAEEPTAAAPREGLDEVFGEKETEVQPMSREDECQRIEKDFREFFAYLENKDYIKELELGEDLFSYFRKVISSLSSQPPLPAGEGFNYDVMIQNIYHLYRTLGLKDLKLIKIIVENEADAMEVNLALFYRWLMSGDTCGREEGLPPTLDITYRYAGYLINSIGGRAYLFRRGTRLRLLLTYYCILVIHEADKEKLNSFGIDIRPYLEPLADEIENYHLLYFRREYAGRLIDLKNYYAKKRSTS